MCAQITPDEAWKTDPDAAVAELERRIDARESCHFGDKNFAPLERLPANIADWPGTALHLYATRVRDISALSRMTHLRAVTLPGTVTDVSALSALTGLKVLGLDGTKVDDLGPLEGCTALSRIEGLHVHGPEGTALDLSPLGRLPRLAHLILWLRKEQSLPAMPNLQSLSVMIERDILVAIAKGAEESRFRLDLSFLAASPDLRRLSSEVQVFNPPPQMPALENVFVRLADPTDLGIIACYPALTELNLSDSRITDLWTIPEQNRIRRIDLSRNPIRDIRPLARWPHLEEVGISETPVTDITPLSGTKVTRIHASGSAVTTLAGWKSEGWVSLLDLSKTGVSDLRPLAGSHITWLWLSDTPLRDLRDLSRIKGLTRLHISGTKVARIPRCERHADVLDISEHDYDDWREGKRFEFSETPLAASGWKLVLKPRYGRKPPSRWERWRAALRRLAGI